jgi:hypothetical protein
VTPFNRYAQWYIFALGELAAYLFALSVAALVDSAARRLPQPLTAPDCQRATMHASDLAAGLWDRYRNPQEGANILWAAVLDADAIRWLAVQIQHEYQDGPEKPPVSHEVHT